MQATATLFMWAGAIVAGLRRKHAIVTLRYLLILVAILGALSLAADILFFPSRLRPEAATLIFPVLFMTYLFASSRVRSVFLDRTWKQPA